MPFNGFGVFQRVRNWVADAAGGIKIRADFHDTEDDGFATGLTQCITKDGQTTITQNIPWNSKRITGLADPVNPQDAVTKQYTDTKLTSLPAPVNGGDATNKTYVDTGDATANAAAANALAVANAAAANANNRVLRSGDVMSGNLSAPNFIAGQAMYVRADGNVALFFQNAAGANRSTIYYNFANNSFDVFGPATTSLSIPGTGKVQASNGIQSKAGYGGGYGTVCYNLNWDGAAGKFHLYADDIHLGLVPYMADVTALEDRLLARIEALERRLA